MKAKRDDLVMAFYPNARGFAYVIFEGPFYPVDWGVSDVLHKEGRVSACVRRLSALMDRYRPDCLILREGSEGGTSSAKTLGETAEELAGRKGVPTYQVSRQDIQRAFAHLGSPTRCAIAESIAKQIPMFAPLMPPPRKIWNGEDRRMALFDAVALAVTFLQHKVSQER
jgi:hypothetical protein